MAFYKKLDKYKFFYYNKRIIGFGVYDSRTE